MSMKKVIELTHANTDSYMTVDQAAKYLGVKETTLRDYLTSGRLTTFRLFKSTLISREEAEKYRK